MPHNLTPPVPDHHQLTLVHDFLIQMGGAEKVVEVMAEAYPDAPIHTSATFGANLFPVFRTNRVRNTWMQHIPGMPGLHKKLFFLYPFAFLSHRLPQTKVAWISSSSFAKWIPKPAGAKFICYCHTPPRYFWSPDEYLENEIRSPLLRRFVRSLMPLFRWSDKRQSRKFDLFIANSRNVQQRIRDCYGKESVVIYPPVNVDRFQVSDQREDFFIIVSRLVSYKRVDLAVKAFTQTGRKLVVIGDGPDRERLEKLAGPSVTFLGRASDEEVTDCMARCRGFVFPGLEDFGITPVEAQACGKPVIAFRGGGALETVIEGKTGVFFDQPDSDALASALQNFDAIDWDPQTIRRNAERFSTERFLEETRQVLRQFEGSAVTPTQPCQVADSTLLDRPVETASVR